MTYIPIAKPWLDEREQEAVRRPLASGWVMQGPEVAAFEQDFAAAMGAPFACAVSSGTSALHLALRAVGVVPGDEVVTASHSFIATANSIRMCGAVPVFADIDPATFNLVPAAVERAITERTRAIMCVHQMGMPCDLFAIAGIARRHRLPLVEDAACASGSEIQWEGQWERIGRPRGVVATFSFHPRKLITTGDGGMITTADAELDAKVRLWRQHSMGTGAAGESFTALGWNYRMTDLQAAVGRVQLERLPEMVARRRAQAARYHQLLAGVAGLILPIEPPWARSNWQSYCVRLPDGADQATVMKKMHDQGVATRRGIGCAHREPVYRVEPWSCGAGPGPCGCAPATCARLIESERAQDRSLALPIFHQLSDADQDRVVTALSGALAE